MKKILLVDDEPAVREGLPVLIDWASLGYEILATASDGKEGLKKLQFIQPDLVISDIRMPEMDGLEMIQKGKALGYKFQSIILSGYSEFEYAQKAIQLGSISYLLKPIDEDELMGLLVNLQEHETNHLEVQLVNKLFGNDQEILSQTGRIRLLCFLDEAVRNQFAELSAQHAPGYSFVQIGHGGKYYLALLADKIRQNGIFEGLEQKFIEKMNELETTVLDSGWQTTNQNLSTIADQLTSLEKFCFFYPQQYISAEQINEQMKNLEKTAEIQENMPEKITKALINQTEWSIVWNSYQERFLNPLNSVVSEIRWHLAHDALRVVTLLTEKTGVSFAYEGTAIYRLLESEKTFSAVMARMEQFYQELEQQVRQQTNQVDIIFEIKQYTKRHYRQDLTLKSISEVFNYDPAYLGKKFKKVCGETYLSYLENYRMEKAKEFLSQTQWMIYEVAERTGYNNVNYFHKKFKARYGFSPNEYRRMMVE